MCAAQLLGREVEYVGLTRDTTEADLKQRREIAGKTSYWADQCAVRAAVNGRLLVLEGLEKAERNVLPILNNLIENREMQLEDGRFLMAPERFDALMHDEGYTRDQLDAMNIVRVSERFRVVALGLPVPPHRGNSLDPPLRSRLQCRVVPFDAEAVLATLGAGAPRRPASWPQDAGAPPPNAVALWARRFAGVAAAIGEAVIGDSGRLPPLSVAAVQRALALYDNPLTRLDARTAADVLLVNYPARELLREDAPGARALQTALERFHVWDSVSAAAASAPPPSSFAEPRGGDALSPSAAPVMQFEPFGASRAEASDRAASVLLAPADEFHDAASEHVARRAWVRVSDTSAASAPLWVWTGDRSLPGVFGPLAGEADAANGAESVAEKHYHRRYVRNAYHEQFLRGMLALHSIDSDFFVVGPKGCGKSVLVHEFARRLGYDVETVPLYNEINARDLFQRRTTTAAGDTVYQHSPLIRAALRGSVAVLDGVDKLPYGSLNMLYQLLQDREATLLDGTRLVSASRFAMLVEQGHRPDDLRHEMRIAPIHPAFRVVALGAPPTQANKWLTAETAQALPVLALRELSAAEELFVVRATAEQHRGSDVANAATRDSCSQFAQRLRALASDAGSGVSTSFSTRQLHRLLRYTDRFPENVGVALSNALLVPFLPPHVRDVLSTEAAALSLPALRARPVASSAPPGSASRGGDERVERVVDAASGHAFVDIGGVRERVREPANPALVPNVVFYDVKDHVLLLREMLRHWQLGEHMLLIGNQGVGKNKLVDRFLQLLQREREYIQLHRDTTVMALTLQPVVDDGALRFADSPLVRACRHGRVLVMDEADKAPLEVVSVLKSLLEDGEMLLADGRRILAPHRAAGAGSSAEDIVIHPEFRMFALANRPGYPFLGQDFFREVGDVFSCLVVNNPERESEFAMLREYAPTIPDDRLQAIAAAFADLRHMSDEGLLSYPYSTREIVNIARHLERFPGDGVVEVIENVLGFDSFDATLRAQLARVFHRHGLPIGERKPKPVATAPAVPLGEPVHVGSLRVVGGWHAVGGAGAVARPLVADAPVRLHAIHAQPMPLDVADMRAARFGELKHRFQVTMEGPIVRAAPLPSGGLCMLSTMPSVLSVVSPDRSSLQASLELYEVCSLHRSADSTWMFALPRGTGLVDEGVLLHVGHSGRLAAIDVQRRHARILDMDAMDLRVTPATGGVVTAAGTAAAAAAAAVRYTLHSGLPAALTVSAVAGGDAFATALAAVTPQAVGVLDVVRGRVYRLPLSTPPEHGQHPRIVPLTPSLWLLRTDARSSVRVIRAAGGGDRAILDVLRERDCATARAPALASLDGVLEVARAEFDSEAADRLVASAHWHDVRDAAVRSVDGVLVKRAADAAAQAPRGVLFAAPGALAGLVVDEHGGDALVHVRVLQAPRSPSEVGAFGAPPLHTPPYVSGQAFSCAVDSQGHALATAHRTRFQQVRESRLDLVDVRRGELRSVPLGRAFAASAGAGGAEADDDGGGPPPVSPVVAALLLPAPAGAAADAVRFHVATVHVAGEVNVLTATREALDTEVRQYMGMFGRAGGSAAAASAADARLELKYSGKREATAPKHGKVDPTGAPHVGGNTWAGGTGGADTAGLGGKGGPYRLDLGHNVNQISDEEKANITDEARAAARAMGQSALQARLDAIRMSEFDASMYMERLARIRGELQQMRVLLAGVEAKEKERVWLRHQTSGDLDDHKLVEGVIGERNVYRRRGKDMNDQHGEMQKPKRLAFVLDLSASMYRFNGLDGRLDREMDLALLIMESLSGYRNRFDYAMYGHSGDSPAIPLVAFGQPPQTENDRLRVLRELAAHPQYCMSGDATLEGVRRGVTQVLEKEADEHFVFVISDANLRRYGISTKQLAAAMTTDKRVRAYTIFIASIADQAETIRRELLRGHSFVCLRTTDLVPTFRQIFAASVVRE